MGTKKENGLPTATSNNKFGDVFPKCLNNIRLTRCS